MNPKYLPIRAGEGPLFGPIRTAIIRERRGISQWQKEQDTGTEKPVLGAPIIASQ